jgi:predicted TIM-barrel fold metal-dependent hydrolase
MGGKRSIAENRRLVDRGVGRPGRSVTDPKLERVMFETKLPYPVLDADNHFYEPADAITRHLESEFVNAGKVAVDYVPGQADRHQQRIRADLGMTALPGSATYKANPLRISDPEERRKVVESFQLLSPAYQSRDRRVEVMDAQGLELAIMFPTGVGVSVEGEFLDEPDANAANVRAYNRWVQDDWGFDYKGRILTPANVPLANVDVMIAELERVLADGARTVLLPPGPLNERAPGDPYYDPFWARLVEAKVWPVVHLGYTQYQRAGASYGYDPDMHYFDGFDAFQWLAYWGDRPIMETVASMVFDNLFTRFPELRVGIIEHGAVWAPYLLRKMDHAFMMQKRTRNGTLEQRPSDVVREHFVIAPYPEENVGRVLDVLPVDTLVFGSDFPHPEGLPDPVSYVHALGSLSPDDQRKIMSTNLAGFLGVTV